MVKTIICHVRTQWRVGGSDWRGWRTGREVAGADYEVGKLSVSIIKQLVTASFDPHNAENRELVLHVAVLGMNLETRINAGENTGKTLHLWKGV